MPGKTIPWYQFISVGILRMRIYGLVNVNVEILTQKNGTDSRNVMIHIRALHPEYEK